MDLKKFQDWNFTPFWCPRQPNFTPFRCPWQPNFTPFWCPQQQNFTPFWCPQQQNFTPFRCPNNCSSGPGMDRTIYSLTSCRGHLNGVKFGCRGHQNGVKFGCWGHQNGVKFGCWGHQNGVKFQIWKNENCSFWKSFKSNFEVEKKVPTNLNGSWTYGQNIENRATAPLRPWSSPTIFPPLTKSYPLPPM